MENVSRCHTSLNEGYEYPEILENGPTRLLRDNWLVLDTIWAQKPKKLTLCHSQIIKNVIKKEELRAREMAWQLQACSALTKDLSAVPSTHIR